MGLRSSKQRLLSAAQSVVGDLPADACASQLAGADTIERQIDCMIAQLSTSVTRFDAATRDLRGSLLGLRPVFLASAASRLRTLIKELDSRMDEYDACEKALNHCARLTICDPFLEWSSLSYEVDIGLRAASVHHCSVFLDVTPGLLWDQLLCDSTHLLTGVSSASVLTAPSPIAWFPPNPSRNTISVSCRDTVGHTVAVLPAELVHINCEERLWAVSAVNWIDGTLRFTVEPHFSKDIPSPTYIRVCIAGACFTLSLETEGMREAVYVECHRLRSVIRERYCSVANEGGPDWTPEEDSVALSGIARILPGVHCTAQHADVVTAFIAIVDMLFLSNYGNAVSEATHSALLERIIRSLIAAVHAHVMDVTVSSSAHVLSSGCTVLHNCIQGCSMHRPAAVGPITTVIFSSGAMELVVDLARKCGRMCFVMHSLAFFIARAAEVPAVKAALIASPLSSLMLAAKSAAHTGDAAWVDEDAILRTAVEQLCITLDIPP